MSAAWLLPIVSSVVAAASGGVVASEIMPFYPSLSRSTVLVSYVIWGTGVPLACFVMALWLYRTAVYGVPAPAALPSVFLPLGPCGQGSFGIILLGRTIRKLAYAHNVGMTIAPPSGVVDNLSMLRIADAVYAGGLVTGMVLWGLGLCWYLLAFGMIIDHLRSHRDFFHHSKFSVGLWALTFPLGVFATSTTILASELDSPTFKVIGAFLSVQVTAHWIYVSCLTLYKCWNGTVFVAPELASFKDGVPRRFARDSSEASRV
jgi:tellurite resistance protein TehA-like permease